MTITERPDCYRLWFLFILQVYELHRLYRIQKLLMRNLQSSRANHNHNQHNQIMKFDLEQPAENYIADTNGNAMLHIIDESEIELTLGPPTTYTTTTIKKKKPQTSPHSTSDSGPASFSSSSTGSSHRVNSVSRGFQLEDIVQNPDEILSSRNSSQPPWLFQVLSLNMA